MNFSEMPVEIWADLLEEQGEDTTELREWIASGLKVSEISYYCSYGNSNGEGDGDGYNDSYNSAYGDGDIDSYYYLSRHGHGSSYSDGYDNGSGNGDGYDDSTE